MLEQYGIPAWAAYVIFGLATIMLGLILGLVSESFIALRFSKGYHAGILIIFK